DEEVPNLPDQTLVYCDPPYFRKSQRLYLDSYTPADHKRISEVIQNRLIRPWLVSYDGAVEILKFYSERRNFLYQLQYNAAKAYKGEEIFVFSDNLSIPQTSILPYIDLGLETYRDQLFPNAI
ncbi:MAG: DNA adenine methylase, partial [Chloroflexota bacterium]